MTTSIASCCCSSRLHHLNPVTGFPYITNRYNIGSTGVFLHHFFVVQEAASGNNNGFSRDVYLLSVNVFGNNTSNPTIFKDKAFPRCFSHDFNIHFGKFFH